MKKSEIISLICEFANSNQSFGKLRSDILSGNSEANELVNYLAGKGTINTPLDLISELSSLAA